MPIKQFDSRWRTWLRHNIDRGCSKDELFTILIKEGFEPIEIQHEMKYSPEMNYTPAMPSPPLETAAHGGPSKDLLPGLRRHESALLELYTVDDFLARKACEDLVRLIKARLRPSTISHAGAPDATFRTSRTCDLDGRNAIVGKLDRDICAAMRLPASHAEPTQDEVEDRIEELNQEASGLVETYNQAEEDHKAAEAQYEELEEQVGDEEERYEELLEKVQQFANATYQTGELDSTTNILTSDGPEALLEQNADLNYLSDNQISQLDEFGESSERLFSLK